MGMLANQGKGVQGLGDDEAGIIQDRNLESFQDKNLLNHHSSLHSSAS